MSRRRFEVPLTENSQYWSEVKSLEDQEDTIVSKTPSDLRTIALSTNRRLVEVLHLLDGKENDIKSLSENNDVDLKLYIQALERKLGYYKIKLPDKPKTKAD
mgnify:CR=1 FL=1|tara:strand:+ start:85901 stop:86206 length:306 start_codon:yes stop_codon:yes gene_type:complete